MARECGTVIYRRPCRSKPRVYRVCDVARISAYAVLDGADKEDIIANVASRIGIAVYVDKELVADTRPTGRLAGPLVTGVVRVLGRLLPAYILKILRPRLRRIAAAMVEALRELLDDKRPARKLTSCGEN